jgi:hypothetical protein
MTEQPVYTPAKKRNRGLWIAAAVAVVGVTIGSCSGTVDKPPVIADKPLAAGLLTGTDFGTEFYLEKVTQAQLDHMAAVIRRPDEPVSPPECAEFLHATGAPEGGRQSPAMVMASDSSAGLVYAQKIVRADEAPDVDRQRGEELTVTCAEMTITMGGTTRQVRVRQVAGVDGDGYAAIATSAPDPAASDFTVAAATTKVDEHVVVFVGFASGGVLDESEFVRLANAANERVRAEL